MIDLSKYHQVVCDVIEINPQVVEAAKIGFGFEPSGTLEIGDAYDIITKDFVDRSRKYDAILHDV